MSAYCVTPSIKPLTALLNGVPHAMMGMVPIDLMAGTGVAWFLGTDEVYKRPRDLALLGPVIIREMAGTCPKLENIVSVGNVRAIAFLKHMGFKISRETEMHGGMEFVPFRYPHAIQAFAAHR